MSLPSKRILFDSTFESSAREIAEPLKPGQIPDDNVVFSVRCLDEIEKECIKCTDF